MQILSIHLKNIKSHRDLALDFAPGINVLTGANGVGKSTIFEAIGYALFGVDAQSFVGNVERFISIGARRGEIAVVFAPGDGERYRVSRSVGTPAKWLLARAMGDDFEVEEHKDVRETETRLKGLLGLDHGRSLAEQFELVIGPFQNEFLGPFVIRQPSKSRDKFDEILGIDTWRKTFNETKVLASAIRAQVEALASAIGPLLEQVAVLPETRAAHRQTEQELAQSEKAFREKEEGLRLLAAQLVEIDGREQRVKAAAVEIDRLRERIGNGQEKIAGQQALIAEAQRAQQVVIANTAGKQAFEQAAARLLKLRGQEKAQRQLEQELAALDKQLGGMTERHASEVRAIEQTHRELSGEEQSLAIRRRALVPDGKLQELAARLPELRSAGNALRAQLGRLEGRRAGLEEGSAKLAQGICPFFQEPCLNIAATAPGDLFFARFTELAGEGERLAAELKRLETEEVESARASDSMNALAALLQGLDEQVVHLGRRRTANETRRAGLERLQQDQAVLQGQLVEKQAALAHYRNLQADIEAAEAEQRERQPARDLYVANQDQAARLAERHAELQRFEQLLVQLRQQLAAKEAELAALARIYDAEQHQQLRAQKDALGREVGALGQKVTGLQADLARLSGEIDKLKKLEEEIAAKQARIKAYGEKEELVKFLRNRVFRNVSAYLSERFREEISQRANAIYRIIADVDEELAWGEDYRIVLRDLADGELRERADDQLSGGQTMSAVVALRLALLQTIGARIAFFDEPTSNLDSLRRENLARAFRAIDIGKEEVAEHWYDQLFLISHDVAFTEITDQLIPLGE